jgi:hypothetical protein
MNANFVLKRLCLIGLLSAFPSLTQAAPPRGGHGSGGGAHSFSGGRAGGFGRPSGYAGRYAGANWHGRGNWHGHGNWHGDWHDHGDWHHHHRFSFGFFPYWYPGWGYYDYGYSYYYPYYPDYYPDNGYYDNGYYGNGYSGDSAESVGSLVQDALARRGYYAGQVDGVIGPGTRQSIRQFQRDNGLPVTGRISPELMRALKIG